MVSVPSHPHAAAPAVKSSAKRLSGPARRAHPQPSVCRAVRAPAGRWVGLGAVGNWLHARALLAAGEGRARAGVSRRATPQGPGSFLCGPFSPGCWPGAPRGSEWLRPRRAPAQGTAIPGTACQEALSRLLGAHWPACNHVVVPEPIAGPGNRMACITTPGGSQSGVPQSSGASSPGERAC